MVELETIRAFETYIKEKRSLANVVIQGLDLRKYTETLKNTPLSGAAFLGCQLEEEALLMAVKGGAMVFPPFVGLPYLPYRPSLYTPEELYQGFNPERPESYQETLDARIYLHWKSAGGPSPTSILEALAQRLHDHAITDAMEELLHPPQGPRKVVAFMGGHSMRRGSPEYLAVAQISRALTRRGFFMVSGGGPGAMEATHLGAWFAGREDDELLQATKILALAPTYQDTGWLARAFEVRQKYPLSPEHKEAYPSLGIPTWHYGHEPPNPFASHIAKYFANSIREDGLLTIAKNGVIFSPGSAGTIQEIFQDACQNHYNTVGIVSPMVFYGEGYWKWQKPVFPLLAQLAAGKEYARYLTITDSQEEVIRAIEEFARS